MVPNDVILPAVAKFRHQQAVLRSPHRAMMQRHFFGKCPCLPALHPCGYNCNMIDATTLYRHVSANLLETFAPKQLAGTGNVFDAYETIVINRIRAILEWRSN